MNNERRLYMALSVKELQIGDWMYDDKRNHLRVVGIGCPFEGDDFSNVYLGVINEDGTYRNNVCNIESKLVIPIPLTSEILELNGWLHDDLCCEFHNINAFVICGRLYPFCIFDGVQISYVHELQHALRLRGLTELADNFKV